MDTRTIQALTQTAKTKLVLLVMDGLGGIPFNQGGPTALEAANTPNMDRYTAQGICGLHEPIGAGITPGSGPAHLALFGYDPLQYQVGRGVLSALGIDFDLRPSDVAARGNFCTLDEQGFVSDRRAGRITTETNRELCKLLRQIKLPGAEIVIETVKEHRFLLVLRGKDLSAELGDTDPQETGRKPLEPKPLSDQAKETADTVRQFIEQTRAALARRDHANMILLRGFSQLPNWPLFGEIYGLRAAAIAAYPMYRGLAKLIGMDVLETGDQIDDEFTTLEKHWREYDFFFLHVKPTDSAGEDGDFYGKVQLIEKLDTLLPRIERLQPDVLVVTGDHSTPALLKSHSWHPVPVLLLSQHCRTDKVEWFGERECARGSLGARFPSTELMPLMMANALRLKKFGA